SHCSWPHYHRALLPFPTRRSSDLALSCIAQGLGAIKGQVRCPVLIQHDVLQQTHIAENTITVFTGLTPSRREHLCSCPRACASRSEEHTSELQSRENLVCRLLPEK